MTGIDDYKIRADLFVGGAWMASSSTNRVEVINPFTESVLADVSEGHPDDADVAVVSAAEAFAAWSASSPAARGELLHALQHEMDDRRDLFAELIAHEVGTPIKVSRRVQVGLPISVVGQFAGFLDEPAVVERVANSVIERQPVGVVAAITPWNFPLHQIVCKLAPALAVGCTVVVKPSEVAPLSAYLLFECLEAAGFPPGVVNLVSGTGSAIGSALVTHPQVDHVSFTGSVPAGAAVGALAAQSIKRVTLELGGKSPSVVLDDTVLEHAVTATVNNAFLNSGQTCTAWTRLLVPRNAQDLAAKIAAAHARNFTLGDPLEESTKLGPLVSQTQRDMVRQHIASGAAQATLVAGGTQPPDGASTGYFVQPTILSDVHPDSSLAQEEIFGPVLSIIGFGDDDEAVDIANNSRYGLHGAVWAEDTDRANRVARRLRTGAVDINGGAYNPLAPFGGFKQSGNGRELGRHGLQEFQELQAIQT